MKVAILEVESVADNDPDDFILLELRAKLNICPLSAWDYFTRKIGICGTSSSGKTETAKLLSHQLNVDFCANSFHVAEYATTFIQKYHRNPHFEDQFILWYSQHNREQDAQRRANLVVSDCPSFLCYVYALYLLKAKNADNWKFNLTKLYKRAVYSSSEYTDIVVLKLKDYVENNVRYQTKDDALKIENDIISFLESHKINYSTFERGQTKEIIDKLFYLNHSFL